LNDRELKGRAKVAYESLLGGRAAEAEAFHSEFVQLLNSGAASYLDGSRALKDDDVEILVKGLCDECAPSS